MRRSHRSTRDGVLEATHVSAKATKPKGITKAWFTHGSGGTANPGAQNRGAGSKDVNDRTVVGEAGADIARGGSTNGADGRLGGGRRVGSIGILVASRDSEEDARPNKSSGSAVNCRRLAPAKGHIGDGTLRARTGSRVRGNEVDAGDDARAKSSVRRTELQNLNLKRRRLLCARTAGIENLDGIELGLLGHAVGRGADGASYVRTMAVTVRVAAISVVRQEGGTAPELLHDPY